MAKAGCTGPMCRFLGDRYHSQAKKGRCTDTAGYISDAEINEIINYGDNVKTFYDDDSGSNIMVYDGKSTVVLLIAVVSVVTVLLVVRSLITLIITLTKWQIPNGFHILDELPSLVVV